MTDMVSKDPSLLNSTSIYEKITKELEKYDIYMKSKGNNKGI